MRTKDELFREAQRHVAGRRQRAVTEAQRQRAAALAAHPELAAAEQARTQAGLALAMAAARGGDTGAARARLEAAGQAVDAALTAAGYAPDGLAPRYRCPPVPGHRPVPGHPLPLRGRGGPQAAAGGDQRRQPAGPVLLFLL